MRCSRGTLAALAATAVVAAGLGGAPARADDAPPPPAPPSAGAAAPDTTKQGTKEPGTTAGPVQETPQAATRPRPPPPPPPEIEAPAWDQFYKSSGVPLPPPPPPPDPFDPRLIRWRFDREVSADGRVKEVRRVPQWVDVIDRTEIEEWRPMGFGDLMRRLPNVMVADGGSPYMALPIVRGLGGDRVKVMTDGVWAESQALGVAGTTLSLWDPESTERVEVYHGPGAYLRGADAGGALVNVVPLRPHRHECPEAWLDGASSYNSADNTFRERLAVDAGAGRVAGLLGVTYDDTGDRDTPSGTLDPSTFSWWATDLALDYFLDNASTLGFTGQFVQANDVRTPFGGGDAYTQPRYQRLFLALTMTSVQLGPVFHGTRMSLSFDSFLNDDNQDTPLSLTEGVDSKDKVQRYDFRLQGNLYLLPCHDTWAELAVGYAHLERTESVPCVPTRGDQEDPRWIDTVTRLVPTGLPGTCVEGASTFEADEWVVKTLVEDESHSACWDFHVGARLDYHHLSDDRTGDTSDDFLFGVAGGVARHVTSCLTLFANASYGQVQPSIQQMFSVSALDGKTVYGNPDLDAETSVNGEVGAKGTVGEHATWQVAAFGHWIGDYIGRRPVGLDETWDNLGDVLLYGAEGLAAWRPLHCGRCEGLELFASAGATWSDDQAIVEDVPFHGRAGARWSNVFGPGRGVRRWFVEAAARGATADGLHGDGDPFVTAEVLAGVGLSSGGRRAAWATLGVTNLFDADYTEPFSRLPAPGRSLIASISFEF